MTALGLEDGDRGVRKAGHTSIDRVADRGGNLLGTAAAVVGEQGQLPHEERMATGAPIDGLGRGPLDRSARDPLDELMYSVEVEAVDLKVLAAAHQRTESVARHRWQLVAPVRADQADSCGLGRPSHEVEEVERGFVCPLQVVENYHHRPPRG